MVDRSLIVEDCVLVCVCHTGSVLISVEGSLHTVSAGHMLIVPPGNSLHISSLSVDFTASVLVGHTTNEASVASIVNTFPRLKRFPVVSLDEQERGIIMSLFDYITNSIKNPTNCNRADIDRTALALLRSELVEILLGRNLAVRDVSAEESLVNRFRQMLVTASYEHRDVVWYAEQFGLSPERFSFKVARVTGQTPREVIAEAVIKTAKNMLRGTTLSTSEISARMHFPSATSFCRYFKRYTSTTPQEWRMSAPSK